MTSKDLTEKIITEIITNTNSRWTKVYGVYRKRKDSEDIHYNIRIANLEKGNPYETLKESSVARKIARRILSRGNTAFRKVIFFNNESPQISGLLQKLYADGLLELFYGSRRRILSWYFNSEVVDIDSSKTRVIINERLRENMGNLLSRLDSNPLSAMDIELTPGLEPDEVML